MANVPSSGDRVRTHYDPSGCELISVDGGTTWTKIDPYVGPSATFGSIHEIQQRLIYEQARKAEEARIKQLEMEAWINKIQPPWIYSPIIPPPYEPNTPKREDLNPNEDKTYVAQTDTLSFGKYAGQKLADVPRDYVEWLIGTREKDIKQYRAELDRRDMLETQAQGTLDQIIQEGFKALAKKAHPDMGGSDKQFRELQAAKEQLKLASEEIKRVQSSTQTSSI